MKIIVSGRATATDGQTEQPLDADRLKALDGLFYDKDVCSNYLEQNLLEKGLTGGTFRLAYTPAGDGLRVLTEYWSPTKLTEAELKQLTEETTGQWSDGLGKSSFDEYWREHNVLISLWSMEVDPEARIEQFDDGLAESSTAKATRALVTAIRKGDLEAVQIAVSSGADIEAGHQGFPALHIAIGESKVEIVRFLLESGADANSLSSIEGLPLTTCAFDGRVADGAASAMANLLVEHGADVNRELRGWTPLDAAINRDKVGLQKALKAKGAISKFYGGPDDAGSVGM